MSAFGRTLFHRCTIQRHADSDKPYGTSRVATDNASGVHFRFSEKEERAFSGLEARWVVQTVYRGFFPYTTDIEAGDQLVDLVDEYEQEIPGIYKVVGVLNRRGHRHRHKSATLEKIR